MSPAAQKCASCGGSDLDVGNTRHSIQHTFAPVAERWLTPVPEMGIEPHIARRRTEHDSGLGKVRWVVERTIGWLKGLRRVRVRYDRLGVIMDAWTTLAASVICFRILHHDTM